MDQERGFARYVHVLSETLGHADRVGPLSDYCRGLMLSRDRKSVEPMAALVAPRRASAKHQSMHHFVAKAEWSDAAMLAAVRQAVLPALGAIEAWIVDDTGCPKKGMHSVGVARQTCGQLGKQDNGQVAVSVSVANERSSLPIAYQLYLQREWAEDAARRQRAEVPASIGYATKSAIALEQLRAARAARVPAGVVLADAGYGNDTDFRLGIGALGLTYAVGVQGITTVWTDGLLASRFARVRVRAADRNELIAEEWLVIEWPLAETGPTRYWLTTHPSRIAFKELIRVIKLRWRIERDCQELKQELGLGHYEGCNWRGFHHHATLTVAAYGFLMRARLTGRATIHSAIRPSEPLLRLPPRPRNFIPRGSPRAA